ncbi:MAG: RNA polymerase sigma factor [Cyclobacteriaceae bacterium]|nr:RNA polymerase sigma factor [Cyclobacteriaceae bacterium]
MTDDRVLATLVAGGDPQAFKQLIQRHERLVSHMVSRLIDNQEDLEEICQDVFLKVYERISDFGFQSKLSTWIATIAWRHAINHKRRQKMSMSEFPDDEDFNKVVASDINVENELSETQLESVVQQLADQLPAHYRGVLMMYHVESMNYQEIGEVTGMPEGTVKNYLFRARHLLKEKVKTYLGKEQVL